MSNGFDTPELAEQAFYAAFEARDLGAMMRVWTEDNAAICIHPMGPTLRGPQLIEQSWQQIFQSGQQLRFVLSHQVVFRDSKLSTHCVYENIAPDDTSGPQGLVFATNVYRLETGGWRMAVHHGSPGQLAPDETLAAPEPSGTRGLH